MVRCESPVGNLKEGIVCRYKLCLCVGRDSAGTMGIGTSCGGED
jgi:hypothetical protein